MSAQVNRIAFTGAMPWWVGMPQHDKGQWTQLPSHATAKDIAVIAGMDFDVEAQPLYVKKGDNFELLPGRFGIVRSDTGEAFEAVAVSDQYKPISFPKMMEVGDEIVRASEKDPSAEQAHYETAGTLFDGRTGWALIRLDKDIFVADDAIRTYLLMQTSHDGSSSATYKVCNTRVVCCNTFDMAMAEETGTVEFKIPHRGSIEDKIADARRILFAAVNRRQEFKVFAETMLAKKITKTDYEKLVQVLVPVPADTPDRPLTNRMIENVNAKRLAIVRAAEVEDLDAVRWTAWGALNAVADAEQHMLGKLPKDDAKKVASLFARSFSTDLTRKAARVLAEVN